MTIRVFLVDDHPVIIDKLKKFLTRDEDIEVVGFALNGEDALVEIPALKPDVVVVDDDLPDITGEMVVNSLIQKNIPATFLMTSVLSASNHVQEMLTAGAKGYMLKTDAYEQIIEAVRAMACGEVWLSPALESGALNYKQTPSSQKESALPELCAREQEILSYLARGYSNPKIAGKMNIATRTVRHHIHQMYVKLGLDNRGELIVWAIQQGYGDS